MEFGSYIKTLSKITKDITKAIKNQDMEFMNGKMDGFIRETSIMTIEMGLESFMMAMKLYTGGSGRMDNRMRKNLIIIKGKLITRIKGAAGILETLQDQKVDIVQGISIIKKKKTMKGMTFITINTDIIQKTMREVMLTRKVLEQWMFLELGQGKLKTSF